MDASIKFATTATEETSYALEDLHALLLEHDLRAHLQRAPASGGRKDGGLTLAIAVASLTLSGISTLISVLTFWRSTRSTGSISMTRGNVTLSVTNLPSDKIAEAAERFMAEPPSAELAIEISGPREP